MRRKRKTPQREWPCLTCKSTGTYKGSTCISCNGDKKITLSLRVAARLARIKGGWPG